VAENGPNLGTTLFFVFFHAVEGSCTVLFVIVIQLFWGHFRGFSGIFGVSGIWRIWDFSGFDENRANLAKSVTFRGVFSVVSTDLCTTILGRKT